MKIKALDEALVAGIGIFLSLATVANANTTFRLFSKDAFFKDCTGWLLHNFRTVVGDIDDREKRAAPYLYHWHSNKRRYDTQHDAEPEKDVQPLLTAFRISCSSNN